MDDIDVHPNAGAVIQEMKMIPFEIAELKIWIYLSSIMLA